MGRKIRSGVKAKPEDSYHTVNERLVKPIMVIKNNHKLICGEYIDNKELVLDENSNPIPYKRLR